MTTELVPLITQDKSLVWHRGGSVRHCVINVHQDSQGVDSSAVSPDPRNVVLVVDASGSMGGGKLEAAKEGAIKFVEQLASHDRLSIVSFSNDVQIHLDGSLCDESGLRSAQVALRSLTTRANTNLSGGWFQGVECGAKIMSKYDSFRTAQVLLLTDGLANEGISDASTLRYYAADMLRKGIITSSVGIGLDYSTEQIAALSDGGGGRYHHANTPTDILEIMAGELRLGASLLAYDVVLNVVVDSEVEIEVLGDCLKLTGDGHAAPHVGRHPAATASYPVGSIGTGQERDVVVKMRFPRRIAGERAVFAAWFTWRDPRTTELKDSNSSVVEFEFVRGADNDAELKDPVCSQRVADVWLAGMINQSIELNRRTQFVEAKALLAKQEPFFLRYIAGLKEESRLRREFKVAAANVGVMMDEFARKETSFSYYRSARLATELRSNYSENSWAPRK
jgi:Ca-activated chloride channel family protein